MLGIGDDDKLPELFNQGERFLSSNASPWPLAAAACVAFLGLVFLVWRAQVARRRITLATRDEDVFKALVGANQLSSHEVYVLRGMFHQLSLTNPVAPFVCPQVYDDYLQHVTGSRAQIVQSIRDKVFTPPTE
jgi:hypothetical protein